MIVTRLAAMSDSDMGRVAQHGGMGIVENPCNVELRCPLH